MSQFEGGRRVRCVDCLHLQGNKCIGRKGALKVTPKKKRVCDFYEFKGEYQNSTPLKSSYVPYVDPKTRKLIRKLMKLGVVPVSDGELRDAGMQKITVPASTATTAAPDLQGKEERLIWIPETEDE